ncbi:uncharacterized protein LOC114747189 [Neltuma alba]|uniref:uncharacterized protein LOC114747189 n=1 Tax=Neltuma alba TaxID=207710 RepID=UPI0010A30DE1|nr:uncharacterized protein LOC114747189 [Prosopis alba]
MGLTAAKPLSIPIEQNVRLSSKPSNQGEDPLTTDLSTYRRLISKLSYLTVTRPDISFVVQALSQFMNAPRTSYYKAATRVVRYLKGYPRLGIKLAATQNVQLECFVDADWGTCLDTIRSMTRYVAKFGGSTIS